MRDQTRMLYILVAIVIVTVAVTTTEGQTKQQAEILSVLNQQAAAWNRGYIEGYMSGYWRSEKLIFVSGDRVTKGWQSTLERYRKSYDTRAKMGTLRFADIEFVTVTKDHGVVLGSWELIRESDNPKGKFTLTFRRFKEGWRIVLDHTS
jgi:ketosteroid isomerase-like protein